MGISRHVGAVQHTGGHSGIPGGQLGRLIVLFNNISARQKLFWTVKLTGSGVGGRGRERRTLMGLWTAPRAFHVCYLHVLTIWGMRWHAQRLSQESISNHCQQTSTKIKRKR